MSNSADFESVKISWFWNCKQSADFENVNNQASPIPCITLKGRNLFWSCYFNVRGSLQDSMGLNDFRRKHSHSSVGLLLSDL